MAVEGDCTDRAIRAPRSFNSDLHRIRRSRPSRPLAETTVHRHFINASGESDWTRFRSDTTFVVER